MSEEYNHYTHGVDMCNREVARFRYPYRNTKWWKALFHYFLELSIVNSMVWFKNVTKRKFTSADYHEEIVRGLIKQEPYQPK
mmetsp:Transcript_28997/g.26342  ORF Transcript_28997/g.26342 Transcript_28997/m.26342 type:complete len:82 (+) Transcript_28997:6007-6252(+)